MMVGLIEILNEASDARVAKLEQAVRDAQHGLPDAKEALKQAKAREQEERAAIAQARQRLFAHQTGLDELARQTREAVFAGTPDAATLVDQHSTEGEYHDLLREAIRKHETHDLRDAMRTVLEHEIDVAERELTLTQYEHDYLLFTLLLAKKRLAALNGSELEISETEFANGRVLQMRTEIERSNRKIDDLKRKLLRHDEATNQIQMESKQ